jgi:hypothetical protein
MAVLLEESYSQGCLVQTFEEYSEIGVFQVRSETVHISADAGSTINLRGAQDPTTGGTSLYTIVLSGYTISVP